MAKPSKYPYHTNAVVTSELDGSKYTLGMTVEQLSVEICGNTHPFYTGQDTVIDTAGKIDKFKARQDAAAGATATKGKKVRKNKRKKVSLADLSTRSEEEEAEAAKIEQRNAKRKAEIKAEKEEEAKIAAEEQAQEEAAHDAEVEANIAEDLPEVPVEIKEVEAKKDKEETK